MRKNTAVSYLIIVIAYALAVYAGKLTLDYLQFDSFYKEILIADIIGTFVVFFFSFTFRNSSIYDPYWSVIPVLVVMYLIAKNPYGNLWRQMILLTLMMTWSLRLTLNWIRSWPDLSHEDWRYKELKGKTGKFYWISSLLGIHLFPTLIVFMGMLPVFITASFSKPLGYYDMAGACICLAGITLEYLSDEQLRDFKQFNIIENASMMSGLWAISRHPNYLGELLFWLGLFVMTLASEIGQNLWTGTGFLLMFLLFWLISIPMMEKRLAENKKQYKEYQRKVPILFPRLFKKQG